jgi:hypothetical protein
MARVLSQRGEWLPGVAGGCPKHESYGQNPQFVLAPSVPASFTIELSQPADGRVTLPIGIVLLNRDPSAPFKPKLSSKRLVAKTNYKAVAKQSLTIQLEPPAAGKALIVLVSTFEPDQYGAFTLTVSSEEDPAFTLGALAEPPRAHSTLGAGAPQAAATAPRPPRAPPAPPSGRINPSEDPVLSSVLHKLGQTRRWRGRLTTRSSRCAGRRPTPRAPAQSTPSYSTSRAIRGHNRQRSTVSLGSVRWQARAL